MMEFEEIHIWDFPQGIYIELPNGYRKVLFKLVLQEWGLNGMLF